MQAVYFFSFLFSCEKYNLHSIRYLLFLFLFSFFSFSIFKVSTWRFLFCNWSSFSVLFVYFLPPFLFSVVPLFLGLGILLCDNHFYYFHLHMFYSIVSHLSVKHLALYKETLMHLSIHISSLCTICSPSVDSRLYKLSSWYLSSCNLCWITRDSTVYSFAEHLNDIFMLLSLCVSS